MYKCPKCGVAHRFRHTAVHCLCNVSNSYTLDIISCEAGRGQAALETVDARARKTLLDKMETFIDMLPEAPAHQC